MRLSWNEIRARAAAFTKEWKGERYEKGEAQTFYNEFFEIFGVKRRSVARFEKHVAKLDNKRGFIDLFWPGVLIVEQKSAGRDLAKAYTQAGEYFDAISESERPRYILVSDFQIFELYDLDERESVTFRLEELPKHADKFGFILGIQKRTFLDQDPVNIVAAERVGKLHDALEESGYTGHDLERFLVRLVFCLFADDTGVFEPRGIFLELLETRTRDDGSDLGGWLTKLFEVLDTPESNRSKNLDEDLAQFPYINGDLFRGATRIPDFNSKMRDALIDASRFDWSPISPAIFGSLFQSVMDKKERRQQGAHYTTEKNILKLIGPLFLDELVSEFARLRSLRTNRVARLNEFHEKLSKLKFLDPACGCGNFLVIAYRELRLLELELLKVLLERSNQLVLDVATLSKIDVDQFAGIEIGEFPSRIAETAMWMMDHIMNTRLSLAFGKNYARIPLRKSPVIVNADALETDWATVLPISECTCILGNPPFGGFVFRDVGRQKQIRNIQALGAAGSRLDYVAYWFLKAGEYLKRGSAARIGFVATNSVTQGEQVSQLWPALFERYGLEISFAHRTFAWGSDAKGRAHVHVVIIGLTKRDAEPPQKRLFSYEHYDAQPAESLHASLSPYLIDASRLQNKHLVVQRASKPLSAAPKAKVGSKPVDGGHYILTREERDALIKETPATAKIIRPFVGGQELINGGDRWIIYPQAIDVTTLKSMPKITERIKAVRAYRESSSGQLAKSLAATPQAYHVTVIPNGPFLALPEVSSERREFLPIAWLEPPTIPSNKVLVIEHATKHLFSLLVSRMHMAWIKTISGRLESRLQYSPGITYNTFPWPMLDDKIITRLESAADAILSERISHAPASLAALYDPDTMPAQLRRAHDENDRLVDRLYAKAGFASERDRAEHLLGLYEKLIMPLQSSVRNPARRKAN